MRKIVQCNMVFPALALALAGCTTPKPDVNGPDAPVVPWQSVDATTGQITEIADLAALAEAFPNSSSVRLRLFNAYLAADEVERALGVAEELAEDGYSFSTQARDYLRGLLPARESPAWLSGNSANAAPIVRSEIIATVPIEAQLVEGLAVANGRQMFVTTVISRELWHYDDGGWNPVPETVAANLSGIAWSPENSLVHVASADLGMIGLDDREGISGILSYDPGGHSWQVRPAPEGASPSDIAIGPDGTRFASDPLGGGVYLAGNGDLALRVLVPPGTFRSPQGIAPGPDGNRLYISDYRYGLAIINLVSGDVSRLSADTPMLLDGIDGLWLHEGELIGVQNGISPMRIVALRLSDDGSRITAMRVLEQANPEWTEPLGGDIHEGALYYIGNGSWDLFKEGGTLREGGELRATHIRRLQLSRKPTQ